MRDSIFCQLSLDWYRIFRTRGLIRKYKREWSSWASMKERCNNPNATGYASYGGRGIKICERWNGKGGFKHFLYDMGERPIGKSLDRINVDGNYGPENCRWATIRDQCNNKRESKFYRFKGKQKTIAQWAYELGLKPARVWERVNAGWSIKRALTEPTIYERKAANQSRNALAGTPEKSA